MKYPPASTRNRLFHVLVAILLFAASSAMADPPATNRLMRGYGDIPLDNAADWTAQPGWLGNADPQAELRVEDGSLCLRAGTPDRGMKWSFSAMPKITIAQRPILLFRYRAQGIDTANTDYCIYLNDRRPDGQLAAVRLCDLQADGQPHLLAVDLSARTDSSQIVGLAVQVDAGPQGPAVLWIDRLAFVEQMPAELATADDIAQPRPEPIVIQPEKLVWQTQPGWLGNPAEKSLCTAPNGKEDVTSGFTVEPGGYGMKWSAPLAEPFDPTGYRNLSIVYRTRNVRPYSDYLLAVLGKKADGSMHYVTVAGPDRLVADGQRHVLQLPLKDLALVQIESLAVQLQAAADGAELQIESIRFSDRVEPFHLNDLITLDAATPVWTDLAPIPLPAEPAVDRADWQEYLRLDDWFVGDDLSAGGLPFRLTDEARRPLTTTVIEKGELAVEVDRTCGELYLLLAAALVGEEEPSRGSGTLLEIDTVDRFAVRLEYADGSVDRAFPWNPFGKRFAVTAGLQTAIIPCNAGRKLHRVAIEDRSEQAGFALLALTARTSGTPRFPEAAEETEPLQPFVLDSARPQPPSLDWEVTTTGPPALKRLADLDSDRSLIDHPVELLRLKINDQPIAAEDWAVQSVDTNQPGEAFRSVYTLKNHPGLTIRLTLASPEPRRIIIDVTLKNTGAEPLVIDLTAPTVGPYRLAESPDDTYYLFPRCGAILNRQEGVFRERYSGGFPVQFLDSFAPRQHRGLTLMTTDRDQVQKYYRLEKSSNGITFGVEYPAIHLVPGEEFVAPQAWILSGDGRFSFGLEAYRDWLRSWYQPMAPRKPWFRQAFNFRQRFLWTWDPLYDSATGRLDLIRAVDEATEQFGGIDYLHLFDWGNCGPYGRIYGRVGDYSPYDYIQGGHEALRGAIEQVQQRGVPVGLYIEGYLLNEPGRLGQKFGEAWQQIAPSGDGVYWPESTEMMICPGVEAWRRVQAETYAQKVSELNVDGMYIDQFGFAGSNKDCFSPEHGHPVPSDPVRTEAATTMAIHRAVADVKPGAVIYTEESPVDVTSQYQDGNFTYAMSHSKYIPTLAPLNLFRFAVPDCKTFEILVCDQPVGSYRMGVDWVFFNGEGIWLEGQADRWFDADVRRRIRECYGVLHGRREAFASDRVLPLIPTERGGLFANRFDGEKTTVITLYNDRHSTVRGPLFRLPYEDGRRYTDAFTGESLQTEREGEAVVIFGHVPPQSAGCVVVE